MKKQQKTTWNETMKQWHDARQEMVLGMFLHREWKNPADYYLRPIKGDNK